MLYLSLLFAAFLAGSAVVLRLVDPHLETSFWHKQISRAILFGLFISKNGFVQLLHTQHWSFLSSVLTEEEGAIYFAPIAGVGSAVSTAIAWLVLPTVDRVGLTGLLFWASLLLVACAMSSDVAYAIASEVRR